jgi:hypothetical protein
MQQSVNDLLFDLSLYSIIINFVSRTLSDAKLLLLNVWVDVGTTHVMCCAVLIGER